MSLGEIILTAAILVGITLVFVVTVSLISSKRNKRVQPNNSVMNSDDDSGFSIRMQNYYANTKPIFNVSAAQNQLELPFQIEATEVPLSNREELVKEYFQTRKRYTVINPPYFAIKKVSNFY